MADRKEETESVGFPHGGPMGEAGKDLEGHEFRDADPFAMCDVDDNLEGRRISVTPAVKRRRKNRPGHLKIGDNTDTCASGHESTETDASQTSEAEATNNTKSEWSGLERFYGVEHSALVESPSDGEKSEKSYSYSVGTLLELAKCKTILSQLTALSNLPVEKKKRELNPLNSKRYGDPSRQETKQAEDTLSPDSNFELELNKANQALRSAYQQQDITKGAFDKYDYDGTGTIDSCETPGTSASFYRLNENTEDFVESSKHYPSQESVIESSEHKVDPDLNSTFIIEKVAFTPDEQRLQQLLEEQAYSSAVSSENNGIDSIAEGKLEPVFPADQSHSVSVTADETATATFKPSTSNEALGQKKAEEKKSVVIFSIDFPLETETVVPAVNNNPDSLIGNELHYGTPPTEQLSSLEVAHDEQKEMQTDSDICLQPDVKRSLEPVVEESDLSEDAISVDKGIGNISISGATSDDDQEQLASNDDENENQEQEIQCCAKMCIIL